MGALVAEKFGHVAATSHMRALLALCLGLRAAHAAEPLGVLGMGSNVVDKFYRLRGAGGMKDVMGAKGYFAADGEARERWPGLHARMHPAAKSCPGRSSAASR